MLSLWIIWTVAALVLLIIELVTGTVAALCLSTACVVSIIPSLLGIPLLWQIVIFVVAAILAFIFLPPIMKRFGNTRETKEYRTNMDALIGRTGKVTHEITTNYDDGGRVQIDGDSWLAYTSEAEAPIRHGEQIIVESYDSLVLQVRRKQIK